MRSERRSNWARLGVLFFLPALALMAAEPGVAAGAEDAETEGETVFEMREVPVFSRSDSRVFSRLVRGQSAQCDTEPNEEVKAYPKLKSKRPFYGTVTFDREYYDPNSGKEFHFVVDESGEALAAAPAAEEKSGDAESEEKVSLLERLSSALLGTQGKPPEKEAPEILPITYDRLYFDLNGDLDLTNDPVVVPMESPPSGAVPNWDAKQKVVFEYLAVPFEYGAEGGKRPFQIMPRFFLREREGEEYAYLYFTAATARKGEIHIGSQRYDAVLGQPYLITGRFDRPYTGLYLSPVDSPGKSESWWGADQLCAMRQVDGKYYTTSTTPAGDKLFVRPYEGEFGVFEIGPGARDIQTEKLGISGSLRSKSTAVPVGAPSDSSPSLEKVQRCELPVGDYLPDYVSIELGRLQMSLSNNYHSDGQPRDRQGRPPVFGIKIRKDKPYVLDFSREPAVMFASPAKDQTFAPGEEVSVKAVLIDPVLDVMVRRLRDATRQEEKTIEFGDGRTGTYRDVVSLDPTVTITNSAGERVSEGKMPFG